MQDQFNVDRGSCSVSREGYEAQPLIEPNRPRKTWQFVEDFQLLAGEDAEPDALFFVESWSLGASEALANLQRRRLGQADSERKSRVFAEPDSFGPPLLATDIASRFEPGSSTRIPVKLGYDPAAWQGSAAEPHLLPEEWDRTLDSVHPMTEERARELLGVTGSSTRRQIKVAYRETARQWHPDRLEHSTGAVRQFATEQMAAVNEAYRLLLNGRV
jgi:hypothetical protein